MIIIVLLVPASIVSDRKSRRREQEMWKCGVGKKEVWHPEFSVYGSNCTGMQKPTLHTGQQWSNLSTKMDIFKIRNLNSYCILSCFFNIRQFWKCMTSVLSSIDWDLSLEQWWSCNDLSSNTIFIHRFQNLWRNRSRFCLLFTSFETSLEPVLE